MTGDFADTIRSALNQPLSTKGYDLVDVVPLPQQIDPSLKIRTIREIIAEFDASDEQTSIAYFVKLRPKPDPGISQSDVYLRDGKLNVQFLQRNAEILLQAGDFALARNIFMTLLSGGDNPAQFYYGIGCTHLGEGDLLNAQRNLEEAISYLPTLNGYRKLSQVLTKLDKFQSAAEVLDRAISLKGIESDLVFDLHRECGDLWLKAQKPEKASEHYLKALEIKPRSDDMHSNIGSVWLQSGRIAEAMRAFEDAVDINPSNHHAFIGLGCAYLAEGDKKAAHDCFARALDIHLTNPTAVYYLLKCAYEIKSFSVAARIVGQYVETAPVNANLLYSLAGIQYHMGDFEKAHATINKVLVIRADHAGALELKRILDRGGGT